MPVNSKQTSRIIIVDPSLKDNRGHHSSLTRVIVSAAVTSGYEVTVFCNRNVASGVVFDGAVIKPVFSLTMYDYFQVASHENDISFKERLRQAVISRLPEVLIEPLKRIRNGVKKNLRSLLKHSNTQQVPHEQSAIKVNLPNELMAAMLEEKVAVQDIVLVHTSDAIMYRSILQLIQQFYPGGHPSYHLCTPYDDAIMPHTEKGLSVKRVVSFLNLLGALNRYVFLYAENELLAQKLSADWKQVVETLDIPMFSAEELNKAILSDKGVLRVIYLGAARDEKGFNKIPEIVEEVLKLEKLKVEFVIQCNAQLVGYDYVVRQTIEKLKQFPETLVRLITEQQSIEDYYSLLESSDIVLACYQKERYQVRGSGVATEAVVFGKNIIATPETYPAWLAGEAAVEASTCEEIARGILKISQDLAGYQEKAKNRSIWYVEKSRPDRYMKKLSSMVLEGKKRQAELDKHDLRSRHSTTDDDLVSKTPYNALFQDVDISEDGHPLYVKGAGGI